MKKTVLFCFLLLVFGMANAQMITGVWRGTFTRGKGMFAKSMKAEVKLIKKGDSLVGTCYYYVNPKMYMRYSVIGNFDVASNSVHWQDYRYLESKPPKKAGDPDVVSTPMKSTTDFNCPNPNAVMKLDGFSEIGDGELFDTHLTKVPKSLFPDEWDNVIKGYTVGMADPDIIDSVWAIASVPKEAPLVAKADPQTSITAATLEKAKQEELAKIVLEEKAMQDIIAKAKADHEAKVKVEAEKKAEQEAIAKAKVEAEEKAKQEAIAKVEAEKKTEQEAIAKAKLQEEEKAKQEAVAKAKFEEDEKLRKETAAREKVAADEKAHQEVLARAKAMEEKSKQEAIAKATAAEKARQETAAKAKAAEEKKQQTAAASAPKSGPPLASATKPTTVPAIAALPEKHDPDAVQKFTTRKKVQQGELPMQGDSIELHFYDNAEVDGDSISLFVNGKLLFNHVKLSTQPFVFKMGVKDLPDNSELAMLAENLGAIPPNTALMLAFVNGERLSFRLESTEQSSGTIKMVRR